MAALETAPKYHWTQGVVKYGGRGYEGGVSTQVVQAQKYTQEHDADPCEGPGETPSAGLGSVSLIASLTASEIYRNLLIIFLHGFSGLAGRWRCGRVRGPDAFKFKLRVGS